MNEGATALAASMVEISCCGTALAWNYIARPGIVAGMAMYGHPVTLPAADMMELMPVLLGMLGLGSLRTVEKIKGQRDHRTCLRRL